MSSQPTSPKRKQADAGNDRPDRAAARYDRSYFEEGLGLPYERSEHWLTFFGRIADRIAKDIAPATVLDAGCAMGFLVEALRDRGVEAYGFDISDYALAQVRPDIQQYCWQGSITEPLRRRYALIVSIEVLEHLSAEEGDLAIENLCGHTDDVVFSSTSSDFKEATHQNVRPPEHWATLFGRYGLYRDVDYDLSYVSPQAVRFRRTPDPVHRALGGYERLFWQLKRDNRAMHELAIEHRNELARLHAELTEQGAAVEGARPEIEAVRAQYEACSAELETVRQHLDVSERQLQAARAELDSRSYRLAAGLRGGIRRLFPRETRRGRLLTRGLRGDGPTSGR